VRPILVRENAASAGVPDALGASLRGAKAAWKPALNDEIAQEVVLV